MMDSRLLFKCALIVFAVLSSCALMLAGCGRGREAAPLQVDREEAGESTGVGEGEATDGEFCEEAHEELVTSEAIGYVTDANPGSEFKVVDLKMSDGWARVTLEETGVPVEEATGFGLYLRLLEGGSWEIATTGNGVSPDRLPGAPAEIFEP